MKNKLLVLLLSIIILGACNNTQESCSKLLNEEVRFPERIEDSEIYLNEFLEKYQQVLLCKFDTIDYLIMKGPDGNMPQGLYAGMFMEKDKQKIQYKYFVDFVNEFKKSKDYPAIRAQMEKSYEFSNRKISQSNWESDKISLKEFGFNEKQIAELKNIIDSDKSIKTFAELFIVYGDIESQKEVEGRQKKEELEEYTGTKKLVDGLHVYTDYEKGMNEAKRLNKKTLLFFTGVTCANSTEVQNKILTDKQIQKMINDNYVMICLYVDDRTELKSEEVYYSEILKKNVERKGQIYLEMQIRDYKMNAQPFFVLLDLYGKEIARESYVTNVEEYKDFLKKGI